VEHSISPTRSISWVATLIPVDHRVPDVLIVKKAVRDGRIVADALTAQHDVSPLGTACELAMELPLLSRGIILLRV
jgi:hypothetical protein